jgi:hypothetical protein
MSGTVFFTTYRTPLGTTMELLGEVVAGGIGAMEIMSRTSA